MELDFFTLPLGFQFVSPGPIVVEIGPIIIRWYGLLIALAVLIGVTISQYLAQRRQINPELISDLSIWLVIGAIPAARIYYVLFQWSEYSQHPERIIAIWQGGIAIHGAIIGGVIAALIFAKLKKISFWQLTDLVAPSLILGQAIGRWGNFFNSEAFGRPTNLPWKLFIPEERRPLELVNFEYFHPTFLYESVWNLMVFALLLFLFFRALSGKPRLKVGTLFLVYWVAYSLGRFWIEGLRTDSLMLGPLRIAQIVSLAGITLGLAGLAWLYFLKRPLPDVVSSSKNGVMG
ncbi:MAG: prolipoprotein diacylglyceryl transferase [Sphaerospermopsis sp. SIO1G2]|nr:prolipoprotein diacylglyceryl transferase [Sphaerospermopsis sp. SIO1G1]NET70913.1 prolipoprotein diacylglyceryl transferase [Sphaerospermopsis sp. SIO1G2]